MPFFGEDSELFWIFHILWLLVFKNIRFQNQFSKVPLKKEIWVVKLNLIRDKIL